MNLAQSILIALVRVYRWVLSPAKTLVLGPQASCRFTPTCSEYALTAVQRHGAVQGSVLSVRRVCRCHPWGDCGHDPVPDEVQGSKFKVQSSQIKAQSFEPVLGSVRH